MTGNFWDDFEGLIVQHEGWLPQVYVDSVGHPTVGVGFNLDRPDARARVAQVGADYDQVRLGATDLTDEQIQQLLDWDLYDAVQGSDDVFGYWYDYFPEGPQLAIADMIYNMGEGTFLQFAKTIRDIWGGDFLGASAEMLNSRWAAQVGARATDDSALMQSGGRYQYW